MDTIPDICAKIAVTVLAGLLSDLTDGRMPAGHGQGPSTPVEEEEIGKINSAVTCTDKTVLGSIANDVKKVYSNKIDRKGEARQVISDMNAHVIKAVDSLLTELGDGGATENIARRLTYLVIVLHDKKPKNAGSMQKVIDDDYGYACTLLCDQDEGRMHDDEAAERVGGDAQKVKELEKRLRAMEARMKTMEEIVRTLVGQKAFGQALKRKFEDLMSDTTNLAEEARRAAVRVTDEDGQGGLSDE